MKSSTLLPLLAIAALSSCAEYAPGTTPTGMYHRVPPAGGYTGPAPREPHRDFDFPSGSDYAPHLSEAYRLGYRCGREDALGRAPRNYARAYARVGRGWESYFQEGYADGYDGRAVRH